MVTRLDIVLIIGLYPRVTARGIVEKLQKKAAAYDAISKHLSRLEEDGLIHKQKWNYALADNTHSRKLFWLIYHCFQNKIDYNILVSDKTASFAKIGLEKEMINQTTLSPKTTQKIAAFLSRNGFAIIESKKPFVCRIVYSTFMKNLVTAYYETVDIRQKDITKALDENKLNEKLEKQFSRYKKMEKQNIEWNEIPFIHASLSLEGNTLTLSETEKIIQQNIPPAGKPFRDAEDAVNYKKALDELIRPETELAMENILAFHRTAMQGMKEGAGKIRRQNVRIKDNPAFKTTDWHEIQPRLEAFFEQLKYVEQAKKKSAHQLVEQAAILHNEFQRIHPFIDGNSRTSRALFAKILLAKGFPLIRILVGFFDQYLMQTKLSQKRDDPAFAILMKQITLENIQQAIQKMEYSNS